MGWTVEINDVEIAVVNLGPIKDIFPQGWVNPANMSTCTQSSNVLGSIEDSIMNFLNEYLVDYRFTLIPLYTGKLLKDFRSIPAGDMIRSIRFTLFLQKRYSVLS